MADLSGIDLAICPEAATVKISPLNRKKESGQNTWTFKGKTIIAPGGNP
jgi:hypothetical protein